MELSSEQHATIEAKLPKACHIQRKLLLPVDLVAINTGPNSRVDVALVGLRDASEVACEVEYALYQAMSYHIQISNTNNNDTTFQIQRCKFYLDDASLRIYAAAEHVANFIIDFLGIDEKKLKPYKNSKVSLAGAVGKYLIEEMPSSEISKLLQSLMNEKNWGKTIEYRNQWVHSQPPLLDGMGIVYKRKSRWQKTQIGHAIGIGHGDAPDYTIDSLLRMILPAYSAFVILLEKLTEILLEFLNKKNVSRSNNGQLNINI